MCQLRPAGCNHPQGHCDTRNRQPCEECLPPRNAAKCQAIGARENPWLSPTYSVKSDLLLEWTDHATALNAVQRWHYSRSLPGAVIGRLAVSERGRHIGCVIFGRGATPMIGRPFGIEKRFTCELVRVALDKHETPVSRIVAISLRLIKQRVPDLRVCVSFADAEQGHRGGIYLAGGWSYLGLEEYHAYRIHGRVIHPRTLHSRYGLGGQSIAWLRQHVDPQAERIHNGIKFKYAMGFDDDMRAKLKRMQIPMYHVLREPEHT